MANLKRKTIISAVAFGLVALAGFAAAWGYRALDATQPRLVVAAAQGETHVSGSLKIRANAGDPGILSSGLKAITLHQEGKPIERATTPKGDFVVDTTKIPDGKRRFTVQARDRAGNTSKWTRSYFIDNTKPVVHEAYFSAFPLPVGATAPLHYRLTDNASPRLRVSLKLLKRDGAVIWSAAQTRTAKESLQRIDVPMPEEEGTYTLTLKVRDRAGNAYTRGETVAVANEWALQNVKNDLSSLSRDGGVREAGTTGEYRAMEYIAAQLKQLGYSVERQGFDIPRGRRSHNIIVEKAGDNPAKKFIIGAHYDSKPPSPGANDNGTGPTILLELARVLKGKKLSSSVVLIFFGAEETLVEPYGHHYGSRHYVADMSAEEKRQTIGMLSVDMVGFGPNFNLRQMERGPRSLVQDLLAFAQDRGYPLVYKKDGSAHGLSDHEPFELAGIPAAWLHRRPDEALHTARDTYEHVQWDRVDQTGRLVADYVTSKFQLN